MHANEYPPRAVTWGYRVKSAVRGVRGKSHGEHDIAPENKPSFDKCVIGGR